MNIKNFVLSSSILVSVWSVGCGEESCELDSHCFAGEICVDGECGVGERKTSTNNTSTNNTSTNNTSTNNTSTNNTSTNNTSTNNTSTNNTSTNNTTPTLACEVDPFTAVCHSPDTNDQLSESFVRRNAGCTVGEEFEGMNETRSMQLCTNETKDLFSQGYIQCSSKTFVMEVIFTPLQECDRSAFKIRAFIDGKNCDTPHSEIQCEELPNGGAKITAIISKGSSVNIAKFELEALRPNAIQFDYDLQWIIRE